MRRTFATSAILLTLACLGACDDQLAECEEGRSLFCTCPSGDVGAQRCLSGKLSECLCEGEDTRLLGPDSEDSDSEDPQVYRCLATDPENSIAIAGHHIGREILVNVTLSNCGDTDLLVHSIALSPDSDPAFFLSDIRVEPPALAPFVLAQGAPRVVRVFYKVPDASLHTGTLVIASDATERPEVRLPIYGSLNTCPTAVARARIQGTDDDFGDDVLVGNGGSVWIELDGGLSTDPDGHRVGEYRWTVVEAPHGHALVPLPWQGATQDIAKSSFELGMIGAYVVELEVVDEHGLTSCEPSRVNVRLNNDYGVTVELIWRTPSDLDETDGGNGAGTDLDLHMLSGSGIWDSAAAGTDCFYLNASPDWGRADTGNPALDVDNPMLSRDDTDGGGPEVINIFEPARTDYTEADYPHDGFEVPYEVGVYLYSRWGFEPPLLATVRVFLNREQVPTRVLPTVAWGEPAMPLILGDPDPPHTEGHFWHVGSIHWTDAGGTFEETDPSTQPLVGFPR